MKLHSHSVLSYCHISTTPDKEGYLYKKGELNTSYQRRWFLLRGNCLFYFERHGDHEPLGIIVLESCSVELCNSDEQFAFAVAFKDPSLRIYKMAAEDQASLEAWMKALTSASFSYLRMLATDLLQQYEELCHTHTKDTNTIWPGIPVPSLGDRRTKNRKRLKSTEAELKFWPRRLPALAMEKEAEDDFLRLHHYFGEEIEELRRKWQEKKEYQPTAKDLIEFSK
ncbi:sesquipedalian-1-like [Rhinatrema bivittatum]|uniref:sesquipedalian-1-like n=1 Tax=Rhinatrema bivittatum TaxID=194408 RepID=UPI00112E0C2F|nr:sesquipedalian-1-like [Rhinatrema bivittatum]XP_029462652.1 sesquipedalian-1-like [Rhinatrema bivittatum]